MITYKYYCRIFKTNIFYLFYKVYTHSIRLQNTIADISEFSIFFICEAIRKMSIHCAHNEAKRLIGIF